MALAFNFCTLGMETANLYAFKAIPIKFQIADPVPKNKTKLTTKQSMLTTTLRYQRDTFKKMIISLRRYLLSSSLVTILVYSHSRSHSLGDDKGQSKAICHGLKECSYFRLLNRTCQITMHECPYI